MTVIEKLSDRHSLIFEAIRLILVNEGDMPIKKLQYRLFSCGVYINSQLLQQAISVMKEQGAVKKARNGKETTGESTVQPEPPGPEAQN
jgi:predicted transcriptional regulator